MGINLKNIKDIIISIIILCMVVIVLEKRNTLQKEFGAIAWTNLKVLVL